MKRGPPKRAPCRVAVCLVLVDVDLAAPCASITAFTDTNNNGVNNGEPSDTATRTRVVPSSSPGLRNRDHRRRLDRRANGDQARGGVRGPQRCRSCPYSDPCRPDSCSERHLRSQESEGKRSPAGNVTGGGGATQSFTTA